MGKRVKTNRERHRELQRELEELLAEEVENLDEHTRFGYRPGVGRSYILSPRKLSLSPRHKLIADMAAIGMKPSDIAKHMKTNPQKSCGGHYNRLLRDPRMEARVTSQLEEQVKQAKEILQGVVVKAAENFRDAVHEGDMKASKTVLEHAQVISPRVPTNVNNIQMNFGDWLSQAEQDKKQVDVNAEAIPMLEDEPEDEGIIDEAEFLPDGDPVDICGFDPSKMLTDEDEQSY